MFLPCLREGQVCPIAEGEVSNMKQDVIDRINLCFERAKNISETLTAIQSMIDTLFSARHTIVKDTVSQTIYELKAKQEMWENCQNENNWEFRQQVALLVKDEGE
jgi:hypothetical protein